MFKSVKTSRHIDYYVSRQGGGIHFLYLPLQYLKTKIFNIRIHVGTDSNLLFHFSKTSGVKKCVWSNIVFFVLPLTNS